jgi:uncharacterized protein DUF559
VDRIPVAYLDMGWREWMVAVEYDGDQHRIDRRQYVKDIRRQEMLDEMGWTIVRVVAEDAPGAVLRRVRAAIAAPMCGNGFECAHPARMPAISRPGRTRNALDAHSTRRGRNRKPHTESRTLDEKRADLEGAGGPDVIGHVHERVAMPLGRRYPGQAAQ